ncbi:MAG: MBL fold metallo-hydrolase, partial [Burkholderiaceae bacterium]|nr:MBL fold metallo-hydrolase [Burkholderiaceae bacterium]
SPPLPARQTLEALRQRGLCHELRAPHYLLPGVGATGPVPRLTAYEDTGDALFKDWDKKEVDSVEDDQSMWFETEKGLVVLLGCCHSGVVNTVNYVKQISGMARVRGVIGGMHLLRAGRTRMEETLRTMAAWDMAFLIPCHCTGDGAKAKMQAFLGKEVVTMGAAGTVVDLGEIRGSC